MVKVIKNVKRTFSQSIDFTKQATESLEHKPVDTHRFIADAKAKSESYLRIQKMRESIGNK